MGETENDAIKAEVSMEDMLATRLAVSGVTVRGASRTRSSFLDYIVSPIVSTGGTFEGVLNDVSLAVERLRSTGCFKGVEAYIDRGADNDAHVTVTVSESPLYKIHTGTSVETSGDRDASIEGSLTWRNITGRGETLKAMAEWWGGGATGPSFGESPSNSIGLEYVAPFALGLNTSVYGRISQATRNHEDKSSYTVNAQNAEVGVDTPLGSFSYSSTWREMCHVAEKASVLVRDEAGHSWKSAIRHRIAVDHRNDAALPTSGLAASIDTEIAGIFDIGEVNHKKVEANLQYHVPIGASGTALSLSGQLGAMMTRERDRVRIQDRFFLGGPNSLRGFLNRGVGPRDSNDALGGESFYVATVLLSTPTPQSSLLSQLFGARLHAFCTVGDIADITDVKSGFASLKGDSSAGIRQYSQGLRNAFSGLKSRARVAVGLGIAGDTALGRIELNLCNVIQSSSSDRAKTGVQFGLSQSFS